MKTVPSWVAQMRVIYFICTVNQIKIRYIQAVIKQVLVNEVNTSRRNSTCALFFFFFLNNELALFPYKVYTITIHCEMWLSGWDKILNLIRAIHPLKLMLNTSHKGNYTFMAKTFKGQHEQQLHSLGGLTRTHKRIWESFPPYGKPLISVSSLPTSG